MTRRRRINTRVLHVEEVDNIKYIRNEIDAMFQDRRIYLNSKGLLNKQTEIQW